MASKGPRSKIDHDYRAKRQKGEAENHRATFTYNSTVTGGHIEGNEICLHISETKSLKEWNETSILQPELVLVPKLVVNSAGLSAPALAKRFTGLQNGTIPPAYYVRGCYFTLSNTKAAPFRRFICPILEDGGLGVHVTLDLNGQVKRQRKWLQCRVEMDLQSLQMGSKIVDL